MASGPSNSSNGKKRSSSAARLPEPPVSNDALLQAAASLVPHMQGGFTAACFRAKQMGELIGCFPEYEAAARGDLQFLFTKARGWKNWKGGVCWITELAHFKRAEPAFLDFSQRAGVYSIATPLLFRGQLISIISRGLEHWQREGFLADELVTLQKNFRAYRFSS